MIRLSPELSKIVRIVPSQKMLIGLICNVEHKAISAESGTAHGLSPRLAILDEVGQVRGPHDAFIEAIETAQGAHDDPFGLCQNNPPCLTLIGGLANKLCVNIFPVAIPNPVQRLSNFCLSYLWPVVWKD